MAHPISAVVCNIFVFYYAGIPIHWSAKPRGLCDDCCEVDEERDIKYLLYTRNNLRKPDQLDFNYDTIYNSHFQYSELLIIYLHGFTESPTGGSGPAIRDAFLNSKNYNVILVDWSAFAVGPWYSNAVDNIPIVGENVSSFIEFLIHTYHYNVDKIIVIGFSLGAQLAGYVGEDLRKIGILLPSITALDPALPLFEKNSKNRWLGRTSARFVDVIHTDGGIFGSSESLGHADFYPNGGIALQPGCLTKKVAKGEWFGIISCSHERSWKYFIDSIKLPRSFHAERCVPNKYFRSSCRKDIPAYMGIAADRRLRGNFYLHTNSKSPFGKDKLIINRKAVFLNQIQI